ncbi:MAG: hypothetical protein K8R87_03160 [Verrucomicrobia bacterium]|nr:hypothetical protein [Verrucomicrobiota bacterium]
MKTSLCFLFLMATLTGLFAGERGLLETFQPLNSLDSERVTIAPVMCYADNTHVGWHQAIRYIAAKYVPPSLADKPVGDINVASLCGLSLWAGDGDDGRITIYLDFRSLKIPKNLGYTETAVVTATLECMRRVAGDKLNATPIETKFKPEGQEAIKELVSAFIQHPKDKEFQPQ